MTAERKVFRYTVPIDDQWHELNLAAAPLAVAAAGDAVEFWAEDMGPSSRYLGCFRVFGTGHPLPPDALWAGTCTRTAEGLVWHLYERKTR